MGRRTILSAFFAVVVFSALPSLAASSKPVLPTLTVDDESGHHALHLVALRIDTTIRGHLARTECELTYRNDLPRVVEADFFFPLPADAELTGLGLYFNGRLRHAVAVEREQARVAYETTVHRAVDPALVEWTSGRSAHLRVYPIPARGEKRVWISYDQELLGGDYELDLRYGKRMRSVEIRIDADGRFVRDGFAVSPERPYRVQLSDEALDRVIRTEGDAGTEALAVHDEETGRWFLAAAPSAPTAGRRFDPANHVVVFWDSSGSSIRQDRPSIETFLDQFLSRQEAGVTVSLIPFDLTVGDAVDVTGYQTRSRVIGELHGIGATNFPQLFTRMRKVMAASASGTRFVLVTDGLTSLGDRREVARAAADLGALHIPLTIVNSSPDADDLMLSRITAATRGWLIDLGQSTPQEGVETAMRVPSIAPLSSTALSLLASTQAVRGSRISFAAESALKPSILPIRIGDEQRTLSIRELRRPREIAMVRSAFARAALRQLLLSMASDQQILEHGRRFQQLTPRTSLLVLESWRDYERWEIPLPDDVREEKAREEREAKREAEARSEPEPDVRRPVVQPPAPGLTPAPSGPWFIQGVVTLEGDFLPGATVTLSYDGGTRTAVTDAKGHFTLRLASAPSRFSLRAELEGIRTLMNPFERGAASGTTVLMDLNLLTVSESITVTASAPALQMSTAVAASFVTRSGTDLTPPDDALLSRLFTDAQATPEDEQALQAMLARRRDTCDAVAARMSAISSVEERIRYYLTARALLGGDKTFHFQAAMLFQKDAPQIASRILSELAEAYPDDSALFRILARIFDGWNDRETARLLLHHALEVAAQERQTWRELVLLEARDGNEAGIERLSTMSTTLGEGHAGEDVRPEIDPLLARWRALPLSDRRAGFDLRVEEDAAMQVDLMWDTNFSDIDLHVVEPGDEEVMYQHLTSAQGGRLHKDITNGYGPEIYTIAKPGPGDYRIAIDYYASDDTDIGIETLVHLIVHQRTRSGMDRQEFILVLTKGKENRTVTTVAIGR